MKKYGLIILSLVGIITLFAEKTLNVYKNDLSVLNVLVSTIDSVKLSTDKTELTIHSKDQTKTTVIASSVDSMTFSNEITQTPIVKTGVTSAISYTSANLSLTVTAVGGTSITDKGICWSTTTNPTIDNNKQASVAVTSTSSVSLATLSANTTYYARAYATNAGGTSYGAEITFKTLAYTLPVVESVSAVYNYSTAKATCVGKVSSHGGCGSLVERGVCWSTSKTPTINDAKYASGNAIGQYYAFMSNLNLNSTYYMRAYATNCVGTSYGAAIVVKPLMGSVTYSLGIDSAANPEPYRLIKIAMDSACVYLNRHTPFKGNIYVYYNTGIPTAQASYHGSIGFGPNTRYMWVGTAIHEMCHFMGSGTTSTWQAKVVGGVWTGTNGANLLKTLTGETLKGDTQHFWPYGINQKEEITGLGGIAAQEVGLANCAKLLKAMVVDDCGLPTTW